MIKELNLGLQKPKQTKKQTKKSHNKTKQKVFSTYTETS